MKKIFSFLTLLIFFFIGFAHNSIMVFAMENNMEMTILEENICCWDEIVEESNSSCIHSCCIEWNIDYWTSSFNNTFQKNILKCTSHTFWDINIFISSSLNNKTLVNKTSPPYLDREITNYSYHTLIKIIKSNT